MVHDGMAFGHDPLEEVGVRDRPLSCDAEGARYPALLQGVQHLRHVAGVDAGVEGEGHRRAVVGTDVDDLRLVLRWSDGLVAGGRPRLHLPRPRALDGGRRRGRGRGLCRRSAGTGEYPGREDQRHDGQQQDAVHFAVPCPNSGKSGISVTLSIT